MKRAAIICALGVFGCSAPVESSDAGESALAVEPCALANKDFDVDFSNCAEFAGIGFVPRANARPLVPAHYELAGDANNALLVVRVARCADAVIEGKARGVTTTSQIGISVTGQDTTASINNYTLFYATDQALLASGFVAAGLKADVTPNGISLSLSGSTISVSSSSPRGPSFQINGTLNTTFPPQEFIASWWGDGTQGVIRSRTVFPAISFGFSTVTLTTPAGSELANLIGGTTYTFEALDSYNTFPASHLTVRDTD